jgi:hypothetical protein
MSSTELFSSEEVFEKAFIEGLASLPAADELGAFILVLANATYDERIYRQLEPALRQQFSVWQQRFESDKALIDTFAPDDVAVFRKLLETGFDQLELTRYRMEGIWQLQFNQLRSFRPARNANSRFETIRQDFNPDGFHFNKPFLKKEMLWEGEINGRSIRLLYNKFPFAPLHGLLVIDGELQKPQYLTREDHDFIWNWLHSMPEDMPVAIAFNALGAYSSVNHQHFQTFVSYRKMPVELGWWRHNGGAENYPLNCQRYIRSDDAWHAIERLHQADLPYNLLYRAGELYCITRRFQGSYQHADWTGGFAWAETMGAMTLTAANDFDQVTESVIRSEMQKLFQP